MVSFHTQETDLYGSRKPYDFNAGGKGLDLLLAKIYGQRFGFDVLLESRRCVHIPADKDSCPGKISQCPHCRNIGLFFCGRKYIYGGHTRCNDNKALKYRKERVTISITGESDLLIYVRDDGPGIPQDELENIFKRFGILKGKDKG